MSRRLVCVSCAERAATGDARVNDGTWQPVCSQACAQQMIGMPKRAAEDDAAQEMSPEERAAAVANDILRLTVILDRIVRLEISNYNSGVFSAVERLYTMTNLQLPEQIDAPIMTKFDVAAQLRVIRDFIIKKLATATDGDVDFAEIRAQIAALINRIADDTALERYLAMQPPASWNSLIPADAQRLVARESFPIRAVAIVHAHNNAGPLVMFRAVGDKLYLLQYDHSGDEIGTSIYTSDGHEEEHDTQIIHETSADILASAKLLSPYGPFPTKTSPPRDPQGGHIFAVDAANNTVISTMALGPSMIFVRNMAPYRELARYTNNTAARLYDLIDTNALHDRTALCAARNHVVIAVDRTNTVYAFDLKNDKQYTVASLPRIDSVTLDALQQVWIASVDIIRIFTITGHRIAVDRIQDIIDHANTSISFAPHGNTPFILSASDSIVWFGYNTRVSPQIIGLQLPPK